MAAPIALSLIVPAYEEAERLPATLRHAAEALPRLAATSEIIVVDDGSRDATTTIAERFPSPVPLRVIRFAVNRGKGAAVAAGVVAARHPYVAFTDADCPYDLERLRAMLATLAAGEADIAIGARELAESEVNRGYGLLRLISGRALSLLTALALGLPFRDSQCGLKLFRAEAARRLFAVRTIDGFGFDFEILTAALQQGYVVRRFPVRLTHDDDSRIRVVRDSLRMARDLWRVRRNMRAGIYAETVADGPERACPLCGGDACSPVAAAHGYRMVRCRGCGLWYLNPPPSQTTLAHLYDSSYFASPAAHAAGYGDYAAAAADARATFRRRLALVNGHVGSGRLLDVGAGYGYLVEAATARFPERWIVERSTAAAARAPQDVRVVTGTWEQVTVPDCYFDVVSMQDCIEHFLDPLAALAKARAALRPGGALLVVTPNVASRLARLQGRRWVSLKFPEHVVLFSPTTLRRALEHSGFRIETAVAAGQYARLDFLASRVASGYPRLGAALARVVRGLGGNACRFYAPSGSIAVVAVPS
ncbi:MAG: bifunctional glycosyltransferase/class I SAM-dependent methyltransferase [Myxococcales bacterium]|nr:bifunctional glycosyltransferase/class I SAM-dependent methyltransferase [Myxococcales bacterium]